MILGVDEVGRGPWAGPLVVGAVVLPEQHSLEGLTDSKKLTAKRRAILNKQIQREALGWGLGWVHADEIDEVGLAQALRLATIRAVQAVKASYHEIIIDGTINFLQDTTKGAYVVTLPKADALVPAVSAASIIAKVARDTYMEEQDLIYPEYGFASHVGYGTAKHRQALESYGVTPLHRVSFAPIAKLVSASDQSSRKKGTTKGAEAEERVARFLQDNDFTIVERNWKTRYCEIDSIAETVSARYFVEVKYRSSTKQGGGLAAITAQKLRQMRFAADLYTAKHPTTKLLKLAVIAVGDDGISELIEVE